MAVAAHGVIIDAVSPDLPNLAIVVGDHDAACSSAIDTIGGYVVVLTTSVRHFAVTVVSTYAGAIDGDTAVTHLRLAPHRTPELQQRVLSGSQPGETHAGGCLLDHAAELQQLLITLTDEVISIVVSPDAIDSATRSWATPPSATDPH